MKNEWHCSNETPDSNAPIWCVDENGCIFTMRLCDAIKKWKYITKIKEEDEQSTI